MKTHIGIAALGIFDGGVCGEKNINYDSYNDNDNNVVRLWKNKSEK